jgi:hypothetical protein
MSQTCRAPEHRRSLVVPWLALLIGLATVYSPTLLSFGARVQTDLGDTRFVHFLLEHGWRALTGSGSYWDLPIFYPDGHNTLAWSENLTGVAPLYWLWRAVGFSEDAAFQLWLPTLTTLNFVAGYFLLRRPLALSRVASSVGAWLFAFAALRTNQMAHQQLMPVFFSAWAVHALVRLHQTKRWGWAALAGAAVGGQLVASVYLGWFLVFGLGLFGLCGLSVACQRAMFWRHAFSAVVAGALFLPIYVHYRSTGFHWTYEDAAPYVAQWRDFLRFGPGSWLSSDDTNIEHRLGLGLVTAAASVAGLVLSRRWDLLRASAALCVLAVMCWPLVWRFVPGASGVRTPCRVLELLLFPAAIGLALLVERLPRMPPELWGLLLAAVFVEQGVTTLSFDKAENRRHIDSVAAKVHTSCEAFIYGSEHPRQPRDYYQLDAMWASLETGVPTVSGYSGHMPPGWPFAQLNRVRSPCLVLEDERARVTADGRTALRSPPSAQP